MVFARKLTAAAAAAAFMISSAVSADAQSTVQADIASAKSAVLVESTTGQVLCGYNEDERLPIASITKIMTLLITAVELEAGRLSFEDTAVCSKHAAEMDGSVIWLEAGEEMSIGDLVKSVVIASANDACVMLAEHIAGNEESFVELMNKKAAELKMTATHFSNCVGYDSKDHYSTARDISVMAAQLRKYSCFDEYMHTRLDSVRTGTKRETQLLNTNKLMDRYPGMTGLKTGTTDAAGCCFCGTAVRSDMELVAVVLGCGSDDDRFRAVKNLLDCGFEKYEKVQLRPDTAYLEEIPVKNGLKKGVDTRFSQVPQMILPKGSAGKIEYHYSRAEAIEAPVAKGQTLGFVTVASGGEVIATAKIVAAEEVGAMDFGVCIALLIKSVFSF